MTATDEQQLADAGVGDPRVARSRSKLLAAARAILVESGPTALTVDAVAERSGVAKSTLYRHWPSRAALVVDVVRENMPNVDLGPATEPFEVRLRGYVGAVAATFADEEWLRIMPGLFALRHEFPEIDHLTECDREEKHAAFAALLAQGVSSGVIPDGLDIEVVLATLIGPPLMAALVGDGGRVLGVAEYAADRFLASYRST